MLTIYFTSAATVHKNYFPCKISVTKCGVGKFYIFKLAHMLYKMRLYENISTDKNMEMVLRICWKIYKSRSLKTRPDSDFSATVKEECLYVVERNT